MVETHGFTVTRERRSVQTLEGANRHDSQIGSPGYLCSRDPLRYRNRHFFSPTAKSVRNIKIIGFFKIQIPCYAPSINVTSLQTIIKITHTIGLAVNCYSFYTLNGSTWTRSNRLGVYPSAVSISPGQRTAVLVYNCRCSAPSVQYYGKPGGLATWFAKAFADRIVQF